MIYLLALVLPSVALLVRGHILQGLLCIALHVTLIGWPVAVIWALCVLKRDEDDEHMRRYALYGPPRRRAF